MAEKQYRLFIDESGNLDLRSKFSKYYVLCGCAIAEEKREEVKNHADHIKFKYWGRTDIVFHSREMSKDEGDFEIFIGKPELKMAFLQDLVAFLAASPFIIFPVIVDKREALRQEWDKDRVLKESSQHVMLNFIYLLLTQMETTGHVVVESSSTSKDIFYLSAFSYFLSPNCKELDVDYTTMQKTLTSVSFVTKQNHDIEEQVADLFTYISYCKFAQQRKMKTFASNSYEKAAIRILNKKLFTKPSRASKEKMEYFSKIESFGIIPKPLA